MRVVLLLFLFYLPARAQSPRFTFIPPQSCVASILGYNGVQCTLSGHIGHGNAGGLEQCDIAGTPYPDPSEPPFDSEAQSTGIITCQDICVQQADAVVTPFKTKVEIIQHCDDAYTPSFAKRRRHKLIYIKRNDVNVAPFRQTFDIPFKTK